MFIQSPKNPCISPRSSCLSLRVCCSQLSQSLVKDRLQSPSKSSSSSSANPLIPIKPLLWCLLVVLSRPPGSTTTNSRPPIHSSALPAHAMLQILRFPSTAMSSLHCSVTFAKYWNIGILLGHVHAPVHLFCYSLLGCLGMLGFGYQYTRSCSTSLRRYLLVLLIAAQSCSLL